MTGAPRLVVAALGPVYRALAPITEMVVRLCAGISLAVHGSTILFGNHDAFARFFESAGFAPGLFWTFAVGLTQFVGGILFALGFLTRIVAVPILIFLLTAISYHWQSGSIGTSRATNIRYSGRW